MPRAVQVSNVMQKNGITPATHPPRHTGQNPHNLGIKQGNVTARTAPVTGNWYSLSYPPAPVQPASQVGT